MRFIELWEVTAVFLTSFNIAMHYIIFLLLLLHSQIYLLDSSSSSSSVFSAISVGFTIFLVRFLCL